MLFQNQFGGIFIRRGDVKQISRRERGESYSGGLAGVAADAVAGGNGPSTGRVTTTYELSHNACETEFRLTVIDEPPHSKTALIHLKDSTSTIAEMKWTDKAYSRCTVHIRGRKRPTIELLLAGAVMMLYGVRSNNSNQQGNGGGSLGGMSVGVGGIGGVKGWRLKQEK
jgi:hypothetical protein